MIESRQNREIVLRQLALAFDEGMKAGRAYEALVRQGPDFGWELPVNPYREEKEDDL